MRLSRRPYRAAVIVHVLSSVAWLGVSLSLLVLTFTVWSATEPADQYAAASAANAVVRTLPVPLGAIAIASGLVLAFGTRWSLRYRWVTVKLVATCVAYALTVLVLRPGTAALAAEVDPASLVAVEADVMAGPIVSSGIYIGATVLSYVKPWGAPGRRAAARPVPARSSR
ncbi:membrane protein [Glycomyces albus]